jgi:formamidopyrimidine-DNA glycosylase
MPELPEVETVRRDLHQHLLGASFSKIEIIAFKNVAPRAAFLARFLKGKEIVAFRRRGKLLILDLKGRDEHLLFHLKMTGQLIFVDKIQSLAGGHSLSTASFAASVGGDLPNKFTRAIFTFSNGARLFFNDLRKFGYIKLVSTTELDLILKNNYGPEPLDKDFTSAYLSSIFVKSTAPIKALILNQKLIAGLGNIYADEALFAAGIDPRRSAKSLRPTEIATFQKATVSIIKKAIKARGTTFRNFVDAQGKKGNFIDFLQVYQRHNQPCRCCKEPLVKIKVAGRGTHYCQTCQK